MLSPERPNRRFHLNLHLPQFRLNFRTSHDGAPPRSIGRALPKIRRSPRALRHSLRRAATHERMVERAEKPARGMSRAARIFWLVIAHGTRPGEARGLLLAWIAWENIAKWMWPLQEIPGARHGIFKVRPVTYKAERVRLRDGTEVGPGDTVLELHTDNAICLSITSGGEFIPSAAAREDMRALARRLMSCEELREVRAIFGLTLLRTFAARLGMMVRECEPGIGLRFEGMYMRGLLLVYTPDGLSRVRKGTAVNSMPCQVWISRDELIRRYGDTLG